MDCNYREINTSIQKLHMEEDISIGIFDVLQNLELGVSLSTSVCFRFMALLELPPGHRVLHANEEEQSPKECQILSKFDKKLSEFLALRGIIVEVIQDRGGKSLVQKQKKGSK